MKVEVIDRLLRNEKGASLIELALMLPILILLVTAGADVASGFSAKIALQQATARTIEKATAGGLNSGAFQILQAEGAAAAGVNENQVTVDKWLECNGLRQSDFNGVCADSQQVARYVSININSSYTPIFTFFKLATVQDGKIPLTSTSSVRVQ